MFIYSETVLCLPFLKITPLRKTTPGTIFAKAPEPPNNQAAYGTTFGSWEPLPATHKDASSPPVELGERSPKDILAEARSVSILEAESPEVHSLSEQEFTAINVVLDSGAAEHVIDIKDAPGYQLEESAGSRSGSCFVAANGERIPNRGEVKLDMRSGKVPIKSTFQVSQISRPLWSVGKLCDAGYTVQFGKLAATIVHEASGRKVGDFKRSNGLYVGSMELRNPSFQRQA